MAETLPTMTEQQKAARAKELAAKKFTEERRR